jgi:hypothetical protein
VDRVPSSIVTNLYRTQYRTCKFQYLVFLRVKYILLCLLYRVSLNGFSEFTDQSLGGESFETITNNELEKCKMESNWHMYSKNRLVTISV